MALLGKLVIELAANTARLQSDMGKAVGVVERGASQIKGAFKFLSGGLAGGLIGSSIAAIGAKAIKLGDDLNKAAIKAGVNGKAISELAYAAKMADVDLTALSTALKKMQVTLSQAASGGKEQVKTLQALGLSIEDLQGLKADQQLELIADQIARLQNEADRARASTEIFGKAGADLLPMFEKGAAGIRQAREEAEKLGLSFGDEQLKALAATDDAIKRLSASWDAFATTLTAKVAPALTRVLDAASSGKLTPDWKTFFKSPLVLAYNEYDTLFGEQAAKKPVPGRRGGDPSSSSMRSPLGYAAQNAAEEAKKAAKSAADAATKERERMDSEYRNMVLELNNDIGALADKALKEDIDREIKRLDMADEWYEKWVESEKALSEYRQELAQNEAHEIEDTLTGAIENWVDAGKHTTRELFKYIGLQLAQLAAKKLVNNIMGGSSASGGFNWSGLFSGLLRGSTGMTSTESWIADFAGPRAGGGSAMPGKTYLIGERGPELLRMGTTGGTITPNSAIGGRQVTYAPTYHINNPDNTAALPRILRENDRRFFDQLDRRGLLVTG